MEVYLKKEKKMEVSIIKEGRKKTEIYIEKMEVYINKKRWMKDKRWIKDRNRPSEKSCGQIDIFLPWTQNLNCSLRPCVSPQIPTFGPRHIYLIGTFDNANKQVLSKKRGFPHIGLLSQQYS